jgi:signal transduction histidine kinase
VVALEKELQSKLVELTDSNRQLKRKIFDLYTVFEISRNFNAILNYDSLLDLFIFTCLGQVAALRGAIFLKKDGQADRFYLVKSKGSGKFPSPEKYFKADSKLAVYLTRLNRPVLTGKLLTDSCTPQEREMLEDFDPGIIVPLIYQTHLSGIFIISEKISDREFQMDDIEFLSILGNQIAVAIENARLYEAERLAMQKLQQAQDQLLQTERLAALGDMSAKVAHEINNPLGIIKNFLLLIRRETEENKKTGEYVGAIGEEIDRVARIVKQLLEFHRPSDSPLKKTDACRAVDEVLTMMEGLLSSHSIKVTRDFCSKCPPVLASSDGLKQVFLNLILNSRDVMTDGGQLSVMVNPLENELQILFCDTGPGIPAEVMPRIFEPFFTTKAPGEGTGLGLSVCYGIIRSYDGTITYRNIDEGGCFEIRLPVIERSKEHE